MVFEQPLTLLLGSFAAAGLLELLILRLTERWQLLATPNARSSHREPTPTAGGLAIMATVTVVLAACIDSPYQLGIVCGAVALSIVGLWDDISELSRVLRFAVQVAVVSSVLILAEGLAHPGWLLAAGFLILWHVNLFNFMDGIDGIAATQALLFAGGVLMLAEQPPAWISSGLWAVIGSTGAFLLFNWPPARIFMGDVGSLFLGFLIAIVVFELTRTGSLTLPASLILLSAFLVDASYTLCTRCLTRQNPFQPHRSHLYQLLALRYGHRKTTVGFTVYGLSWLFPLALTAAYHASVSWFAFLLAALPTLVLAVTMGAGRSDRSAVV